MCRHVAQVRGVHEASTMRLVSLLRWRRHQTPPDKPLRDELLSIERLEERAKSLAGQLTIAPFARRDRCVLPRLADNARRLRAAYDTLAGDVHRGEVVTPSAEWLLDHF